MSLSYRDEVPPVIGKSAKPNPFSPSSFSRKTWIFIGLGAAAVILAFILLFFSGGDDLNPQMQRLTARLESFHSISSEAQEDINNADLRKINSDTRILTLGALNRLQGPFTEAGMGEVPADIQTAEEDLSSQEELEQARAMGTFDSVYARFLEAKIDTILPLLTEIYENTSDESLQEPLQRTFDDYTHIKEQVEELEL